VAGTYFYRAIYEFRDAAGNTWQSQPSAQARYTTASKGLFFPNIEVATASLDFMDRSQRTVVRLFRAAQASGTFHLVAERVQDAPPATIDETILLQDRVTETVLLSREVLYTTGGVLANDSMPPTNILTLYKERILAVESTTPSRIWFTKQVAVGFSPRFAGSFTIDITGEKSFEEGITSIVELYERMIVFARTAIVYITGDGPADTGAQNDFSSPQSISSTLGCINHKATIATNDGVFFASNDGMYLMDRGLTTHFIGEGIFDKDLTSINSVVIVSDQSEIRWTTSTDEAYVYNLASKKWTVFQNYNAKGSVINNGVHTLLKDDGIYIEVVIFEDEGNTPIPTAIETSWLSDEQNQGYMRVYRFQLLGEFKSDHDLLIEVAYDYNDNDFDTYFFTPVSGEPYQFDLHLKRQKCQSIKFRIKDIPTAVSPASSQEWNLFCTSQVGGSLFGTFFILSTSTPGIDWGFWYDDLNSPGSFPPPPAILGLAFIQPILITSTELASSVAAFTSNTLNASTPFVATFVANSVTITTAPGLIDPDISTDGDTGHILSVNILGENPAGFGESMSWSDFYIEMAIKRTSMVFPVDRKVSAV